MEISGNSVLITGGATGIGYALAQLFYDAGNEVIICGRRKDKLYEARVRNPKLNVIVCDISKESDRKKLVKLISGKFINFNILVNNAGIQRDIDFTNGIDEFMAGDNEIRINLEATVILSGLLIPFLKQKKESAIINVSSGLDFVPAARMPVYSATKAGLHAFTMALRYQLRNSGIKVFEVVPPAVDTDLNAEGRAKRGGFKPDLKPAEFAAAVMQGLINNILELGYGMTEGHLKATREELDRSFQQMNSLW